MTTSAGQAISRPFASARSKAACTAPAVAARASLDAPVPRVTPASRVRSIVACSAGSCSASGVAPRTGEARRASTPAEIRAFRITPSPSILASCKRPNQNPVAERSGRPYLMCGEHASDIRRWRDPGMARPRPWLDNGRSPRFCARVPPRRAMTVAAWHEPTLPVQGGTFQCATKPPAQEPWPLHAAAGPAPGWQARHAPDVRPVNGARRATWPRCAQISLSRDTSPRY